MIGFISQSTQRRPVYSVTGQKLCYLESGPDGEIVYTLEGKKLARLTQRHKGWIEKMTANATVQSGLILTPDERYEG